MLMWRQKSIPHKNSDTLGCDTVIDTEKVNNKINETITNQIEECQEDDEVLDDDTIVATGTTKMTTLELSYVVWLVPG